MKVRKLKFNLLYANKKAVALAVLLFSDRELYEFLKKPVNIL